MNDETRKRMIDLFDQCGMKNKPYTRAKIERELEEYEELIKHPKCETCIFSGGKGEYRIPAHFAADGFFCAGSFFICPDRDQCTRIEEFHARRVENLLESSGMTKEQQAKRLRTFEVYFDWQKDAKDTAAKYVYESRYEWLFLNGISGSGKSHIACAVANAFMSKGYEVIYQGYQDLIRSMRGFEYSNLERAKSADILFIDDLYKHTPTEEEKRRIFELIDFRYRNGAKTIITTERTEAELNRIDAAVIGRIKEKSGQYFISMPFSAYANFRD